MARKGGRLMRFLLVDDDSMTLIVYEAILRKNDCITENDELISLSSIPNSEDFYIEVATTYDVVICDNDLGLNAETTGLEFLKHIQRYGFHGKSILLTSDESTHIRFQIEQHDFIDYVQKNTSDNTAISRIKSIIDDEKNRY